MDKQGSRMITAGFLPLVDAALLIAAKEKGFAEQEGVALRLMRESSWANIRDRMAVGHFQCAHMLAPMPIAARLGLMPIQVDMIAPMALGLGGNAVTASSRLYEELSAFRELLGLDPKASGDALAQVIAGRKRLKRPKPVFGVVHTHSAHNYDLRYWLHASGVDPDRDVEIVIVPPPFLPDALANGRIDGFCVGEPWSSVAVRNGHGVIITSKSSIWRSSPEKVLGVEAAFAEQDPETLDALLRALYRAAQWCSGAENRHELASILSQPDYIGMPIETLRPALSGNIDLGTGRTIAEPDFFIPFERAATFPWKSHAIWFYSQIVRWGQASWGAHNAALAAGVYRPDLYRRALSGLDASLPAASSKVEGALTRTQAVSGTKEDIYLGPDGFFDGSIFDPDKLADYIQGQRTTLR